MKRTLTTLCLTMLGCAGASPWVPLSREATPEGTTLVWVGRGACERLEGGQWVRREAFDYEFSVEQRRLGAHWVSVKTMRRLHPEYDGSAGPRLQTFFFEQAFQPADPGGRVSGTLTSTLGEGTVSADREFRSAELRFLAAGVSSMAPFDRYRITQRYDYEGGALTEDVELLKGDAPWVRNHEQARLFAATRFAAPPTVADAPPRPDEPGARALR
ncbi:MAG: hypothetical protein SFW67_05220 [Myxococcaceae bacterium]|nr:hypothetical protein [Myxococcaceae bacterium]